MLRTQLLGFEDGMTVRNVVEIVLRRVIINMVIISSHNTHKQQFVLGSWYLKLGAVSTGETRARPGWGSKCWSKGWLYLFRFWLREANITSPRHGDIGILGFSG